MHDVWRTAMRLTTIYKIVILTGLSWMNICRCFFFLEGGGGVSNEYLLFTHLNWNSNSLFLFCFDDQIFNSTSCCSKISKFFFIPLIVLIRWMVALRPNFNRLVFLVCFFFPLKILIICLVVCHHKFIFLKLMRTFVCKMQMLLVNFSDRKAIWRGHLTCSDHH